jgi:hypothetical protein
VSLPPLAGVAATCLWTLHCRARSAARGVRRSLQPGA